MGSESVKGNGNRTGSVPDVARGSCPRLFLIYADSNSMSAPCPCVGRVDTLNRGETSYDRRLAKRWNPIETPPDEEPYA